MNNDNYLFNTEGGTYGGTRDHALWEQDIYNLLDEHLHGSSQPTSATGAGNSTNIHQAGSDPAGPSTGAYQSVMNLGADNSARFNAPQPIGNGYPKHTAHSSGQMAAPSSATSLAATLQRANASRADFSGPTQPEVSSTAIDPALLPLDRNPAAPPAAFNGGMPQNAAPEFPAGPLPFDRHADFGQDGPAPASPPPVASRTSGAADRSANRQTRGRGKGKGRDMSRDVGPSSRPIPAQGRAPTPQAQPALEQEQKAVCKNGGAPLRDTTRKGNEQGAVPYWNQSQKHHHSRCNSLQADGRGCVVECEFQRKFPLTCAKWSQQRFQVKWDETELPARPETEILSGFAVDARKFYSFKVIGEVLADGSLVKKSKTVHRVDDGPVM